MHKLFKRKTELHSGRRSSTNMQYMETPHVCKLPPEEDIIVRYINEGIFIKLRRWFRMHMLASDSLTRSRLTLKSLVRIRSEQERQLRFHYYMIHPFSLGRAYWEFFQIIVLILTFIIVPLNIVVVDHNRQNLLMIKIFLDLLFFLDIIVTFFTGRYNPNTKHVTLTQRTIAKSYLRGTFVPDILSLINIDVIVNLCYPKHVAKYSWELKLFNFFKLARLYLLFRYLDTIRDWRSYSKYKFKVFKLLMITIILLMWYSCIYLMILQIVDDDWLYFESELDDYIFVHVFMRVTHLVFLYGYGILDDTTVYACYMDIVTMTVGIVFRVYLLCQILQVLYRHKSGNKYSQIVDQLDEYIKYKNLSEALRRRITDYYNFRFQNTYFREDIIKHTISQQLKQRIVMHTCQKFLDTVEIFKDLPASLLFKIVTLMKVAYFLPNDTIVRAGDIGDSMYFILTGTVAVYTSSGKEVCHLYDGNNFGEICLVLERKRRVASVIAVDHCECYVLKRDAFQRAIKPYPDLMERIRQIAEERLKSTEILTGDE